MAAKKKSAGKETSAQAKSSVDSLYSKRDAPAFLEEEKRRERVRAILGGNDAFNEKSLRRYFDWLKENFRFPCSVMLVDDEPFEIELLGSTATVHPQRGESGERKVYKLVSLEWLDDCNDDDGVLVNVDHGDGEIFVMHLSDFECVDRESAEYAMLSDYSLWWQEVVAEMEDEEDDEDEYDVDEQDARIEAILGSKTECSPKTLEKYRKYLLKNLSLPVKVTGVEDFPWEERYVIGGGSRKEYEKLKEENPSYTDEFMLLDLPENDGHDILAEIRRCSDGKEFCMGLSWLKCVDSRDPAYEMLDDFAVWQCNY